MPLTPEQFKELYRRITKCDFESDRQLAAEYKINRNCIYQIRQGTHRYFKLLGEKSTQGEVTVYPVLDEENRLKYTRCKKCGNKVQDGIPCFICHIREYKNKQKQEIKEAINGQTPENSHRESNES